MAAHQQLQLCARALVTIPPRECLLHIGVAGLGRRYSQSEEPGLAGADDGTSDGFTTVA